MPDHLHSIWYVRRPMEKSIRYVAQGFWRAAKNAGRAVSFLHAWGNNCLAGSTMNESTPPSPLGAPPSLSAPPSPLGAPPPHSAPLSLGAPPSLSSIAPASSRENPLRALLGDEAYYGLPALFTEVPFIRPMSRRGQLQAMIRYVQLNPQRLATKRLFPGYFRVQQGIEIAGRTYAGVGNIALLQAAHFAPVHVRHDLVDEAAQGRPQSLRDYMNGCVLAARRGTVMVSPFISPKEKEVKAVLLAEQHPFIVLADNGFRDYYKPPGDIFQCCRRWSRTCPQSMGIRCRQTAHQPC